MHLQKLRQQFIVCLLQLLLMNRDTFATVLIREEDSYAVYSPFRPCPGSSLSVRFHRKNSNGLLIYSEDNGTGRFLSVTLLPNRKLKVELELRVPQYRTTTDHVILMLDCTQSDQWKMSSAALTGDWHLFTLTVVSNVPSSNIINQIIATLDDHTVKHSFSPGIIYNTDNSSKIVPKFGDQVYVGQLPPPLRKDATQRALFSAAMQPTHFGQIQVFMHETCVSNYFLMDEERDKHTQLKPEFLSRGTIWTENVLSRGNHPLSCSRMRQESTDKLDSFTDAEIPVQNLFVGKLSRFVTLFYAVIEEAIYATCNACS
ncbi:hypothetical protein FBUS_00386 [Fasciolopsis buskii]|uniref:Laminin G domain-containing protein n=1 Tax=Fasciolopsis buskii TaxID=27845 RepID=A0A8E0VDU2_9TREM|nr:hypothetical protein FBUS_00386 [Fasciolopsis buski]